MGLDEILRRYVSEPERGMILVESHSGVAGVLKLDSFRIHFSFLG